jgi:hypothetical protein
VKSAPEGWDQIRGLFSRAEVRWAETGEGLGAAEVAALRRLWGKHFAHSSRRVREALPADVAGQPPEPVTEAS